MNRSRLQSSVGIGNPGLLTPDRAGSVLLDEPAVEQGPLMEEDRSSTDSEDGVNAMPVKPRHRVGIPPSPGDVLTPLRTPVRARRASVKKPAKSSPHVKIPPSPALNN